MLAVRVLEGVAQVLDAGEVALAEARDGVLRGAENGGPGPDPAEPQPADGDDTAATGDGRQAPVAIVDLGVHGGSGWTLVRYEDDHSRWRVLRDGEGRRRWG
ncbi:hypothetical protein ACWEBX_16205 [Streptomyces sp. NPDC005070]